MLLSIMKTCAKSGATFKRIKIKYSKRLYNEYAICVLLFISIQGQTFPNHDVLQVLHLHQSSVEWDLNPQPLGSESSALTTRARFHQLGARRKLQKARQFVLIFSNFVTYKMPKLFEITILHRVGKIEPRNQSAYIFLKLFKKEANN